MSLTPRDVSHYLTAINKRTMTRVRHESEFQAKIHGVEISFPDLPGEEIKSDLSPEQEALAFAAMKEAQNRKIKEYAGRI